MIPTHDLPGPAAYTCPHVIVVDIEYPSLDDDDRHHLEKVLRLRAGDPITMTDGAGAWRVGRLGADVEPVGAVEHLERSIPQLEIGFCLVKGSRPELIVQKLTELGIDVVSPLMSERTVVKWDADKAVRQKDRLHRVAREALMQSKGVWLTDVSPLRSVENFAEGNPLHQPGATARADFGADAQPLMGAVGAPTRLAIGPEGGWTDAERQLLPRSVSLGSRVLRAETAALSSAVILCTMRENSR